MDHADNDGAPVEEQVQRVLDQTECGERLINQATTTKDDRPRIEPRQDRNPQWRRADDKKQPGTPWIHGVHVPGERKAEGQTADRRDRGDLEAQAEN